jgi:hypothetical protein
MEAAPCERIGPLQASATGRKRIVRYWALADVLTLHTYDARGHTGVPSESMKLLPTPKGGDDYDHIGTVQRTALNAGQNLCFNPCVERPMPNRDKGWSRLPRLLDPLNSAAQSAEVHVVN